MSSPEELPQEKKEPTAIAPPSAPPELNFGSSTDSLEGLEGDESKAEIPLAEENDEDPSEPEKPLDEAEPVTSPSPDASPSPETTTSPSAGESPVGGQQPIMAEPSQPEAVNSTPSVSQTPILPSGGGASREKAKGKKLTPDEKAKAVHAEQTDRMKSLQMVVNSSSSLSKEQAFTAVILLIKGLRASLSRQIEKMDKRLKKASEADKRYKKLGEYLESVTEKRATKAGEIEEIGKYIKNICELLDVPVPSKNEPTPVDVSTKKTPEVSVPAVAGAVPIPEKSLIERGDEGEATLDNPLFVSYLTSVEKKVGTKLDMSNEAKMQPLREAFLQRGKIALQFTAFYEGERQKVIGSKISDPSVARAISAHIETLSKANPEKLLEYNALFTEAGTIDGEIRALEERKRQLVSPEAVAQARNALTEKERVLVQAQAINRFLPKLKFWEDATGWGRLAFLKSKGREALREADRYGVKGSVLRGGGSFLFKGKIGEELDKVRTELQRIQANNPSDPPLSAEGITNELEAKKRRIQDIRSKLLGESGVRDEVSTLMRASLASAFGGLVSSDATPEPLEENLDHYGHAEARLEHIALRANSGEDDLDIARDLGSVDDMKKKIAEGAHALAVRIIRKKLADALKDPLSPGRHTALAREIASLLAREKIGREKGNDQVKRFVAEEIEKYIGEQTATKVDANTSEAERKIIDARILLMQGLLYSVRPASLATPPPISSLNTVSTSTPLSAEAPATPTAPPASAPPPAPSAPAERQPPVASETAPTPSLSQEQIKNLTFDGLLELDDANLKRVIQATLKEESMKVLVDALSDADNTKIVRARNCLSEAEKRDFDSEKKKQLISGENWIKSRQNRILAIARKVLMGGEAVSSKSPDTVEVHTAEKEDVIRFSADEINTLSFEKLELLDNSGKHKVWEVVRTAYEKESPHPSYSVFSRRWGILMQGLSSELITKVQSYIGELSAFEEGQKESITKPALEEARKKEMDEIKGRLRKFNLKSPA